MTTKPHSNDEVIENIVAGVAEYPHGRLALAVDLRDQLRALLAQKDAEIADARREERERITKAVKNYITNQPIHSEQLKTEFAHEILFVIEYFLTPPDQTSNPTK